MNSATNIDTEFEAAVPVIIVGGGACGLVAALTLADAGINSLVLERDALPSGSTALSSGMIPACATNLQRTAGVKDSVEILIHDIQAKAKGQADPAVVRAVAEVSGPTVEWLINMLFSDMGRGDGLVRRNLLFIVKYQAWKAC